MGQLLFLIDKFSTSKNKILFICSSALPLKNLPPQIASKFIYHLCICTPPNMKLPLFRFIANNSGSKLNMSDQEINNYYNILRNYSNGDIFQVLKTACDLKKQNGDNSLGITSGFIDKALQIIPGSIPQQLIQMYCL